MPIEKCETYNFVGFTSVCVLYLFIIIVILKTIFFFLKSFYTCIMCHITNNRVINFNVATCFAFIICTALQLFFFFASIKDEKNNFSIDQKRYGRK